MTHDFLHVAETPSVSCLGTVAVSLAAALILIFSAPAAAQTGAGGPGGSGGNARAGVKSVTTTLVSSGAYKECFSLSTQQKLRYWYRAEGALDFNVQYVEGKETLYPVKKDKMAIGSGTFSPKTAQDYCVVWTNKAKTPVTLSFEYARVNI
jgi:hypothetical protein